MKKKLLALAAAAIAISMMAAGSLAYFTAETKTDNVITTGNIDVELIETARTEDGKNTVPFENVTGVVPGAKVSKIVQVKNTGDNEAYVRIQVQKEIVLKSDGEADLNLISVDIDKENWTEKEGFFYYNKVLNPGDTTTPLFTEVTFNSAMDNTYQNCTAGISVAAHAVQVANNGATVMEAAGWPE